MICPKLRLLLLVFAGGGGDMILISRMNSARILAAIYSAADAFVNTTYEDNYPTVNIEAMSCGTPVISYDVGGSKESVLPAGGIIVEKGNLLAVIDAIRVRTAKCEFNRLSADNARCIEKYIECING